MSADRVNPANPPPPNLQPANAPTPPADARATGGGERQAVSSLVGKGGDDRVEGRATESNLDPALLDLPFDQYSRHMLVRRVAERIRTALGAAHLEVLDVGGYPGLTPRFLPNDRVIVTDITPDQAPGARYVRADGGALPFPDHTFDLVTSLDSLEHVPAQRRAVYVGELLRVSRGYVVLIAPFASEETELFERLLAEFVRVMNQDEQPQLREHRAYGLPRLDEWEAWLRSEGYAFIPLSSGFVYNWLPMMLVKHYVMSLPGADALHATIDRFYNTVLQRSDARAPGYRKGFIIASGGPADVLPALAEELAQVGEPDRLEVVEQLERIGLLLKLADLHISSRRDDRLRDEVVAKERHIANLEALLGQARAATAAAESRAMAAQAEADQLRAHLAAVRNGRVMRVLDAFSRLTGRAQ